MQFEKGEEDLFGLDKFFAEAKEGARKRPRSVVTRGPGCACVVRRSPWSCPLYRPVTVWCAVQRGYVAHVLPWVCRSCCSSASPRRVHPSLTGLTTHPPPPPRRSEGEDAGESKRGRHRD